MVASVKYTSNMPKISGYDTSNAMYNCIRVIRYSKKFVYHPLAKMSYIGNVGVFNEDELI